MSRKQLLQTPLFLLAIMCGAIIGLAGFVLVIIPLLIKPDLVDAAKNAVISKMSREFMRAMMRRNSDNVKVVA